MKREGSGTVGLLGRALLLLRLAFVDVIVDVQLAFDVTD